MKSVSKDTIIRTIVTFVALVNSVLTMIGKNPLPFSDDEVYLFFSTLLTVFSTIWSWWKIIASPLRLLPEILLRMKQRKEGTPNDLRSVLQLMQRAAN